MTYTPTTDDQPTDDDMREQFVAGAMVTGFAHSRSEAREDWAAWLVAHDAEVRAQALREAADELDRQPAKAKHGLPMMLRADWLRDRANCIEQGGQP